MAARTFITSTENPGTHTHDPGHAPAQHVHLLTQVTKEKLSALSQGPFISEFSRLEAFPVGCFFFFFSN